MHTSLHSLDHPLVYDHRFGNNAGSPGVEPSRDTIMSPYNMLLVSFWHATVPVLKELAALLVPFKYPPGILPVCRHVDSSELHECHPGY
jgi:hypothetical protein